MKRISIIAILISLFAFTIQAQPKKGDILLKGSSNLGLQFENSVVKSDADDYDEPDPTKTTYFNLGVGGGYTLMDGLAAGLNMNWNHSGTTYPDDDKYINNSFLIGPFARYYIGSGVAIPFVQGNASFGNSKYKNEPDDGDDTEQVYSLTRFGGGVGAAIYLNDFISLDIMAMYNSNIEKKKDDTSIDNYENDDNVRTVRSNFGLQVGLSFLIR